MDVRLPKLGEGADSGVVVNILVKEGDQVQKDQPVLELETEKAVGTIPSSAAGTVTSIRVKLGDKISAGQVMFSLADGGAGAAVAAVGNRGRASQARPMAETGPAPREGTRPTTESGYKEVPGFSPPASPSVRKMARDLGIDLARVRGSAHGGRILLEDVRAYIEQLQALAGGGEGGSAKPAMPAERIDFSHWGPIYKKPVTPLRQTIARRLSESWTSVPRVTQFDEADITALDELR